MKEQQDIIFFAKDLTSKGKKRRGFFRSDMERALLFGSMIVLFPTLIMMALDKKGIFLLLLIILFYLLIMAYQIAVCVPAVLEMARPTEKAIDSLVEEMNESECVFGILDTFCLKDICIAKSILSNKVKHLTEGTYFILGKLNSLGVVPTAVAMYLAYHELALRKFPMNFGVALTALLAGMYLGSIAVHLVKIRYSDMVRVLEIAGLRVSSSTQSE